MDTSTGCCWFVWFAQSERGMYIHLLKGYAAASNTGTAHLKVDLISSGLSEN